MPTVVSQRRSLRSRLRLPRVLLCVLRRFGLGVAAILVALALAGLVFLFTLPSVDGASRRVQSLMTSHHEAAQMPVPARLAAAVVSTEDEHFYDNVVVNVLTGVGRAALATMRTSEDPGGSTIDQQLASELYGRRHGVLGTLREIGVGVKLALDYSKPRILAMYLNVSYYGEGFWGVQQAAEGYFRVTPAKLSWAQAAMLAGLLQAPTAYDPLRHLGLAKQRQAHVLAQLVANHHLTQAEARGAYLAPLGLR